MGRNKKIKYSIDQAVPPDDTQFPVDTHPESVEKKTKDFIRMHQRVPLTRRDFLGAGLIQFGGFLSFSPLIKLLNTSTLSRGADIICSNSSVSDFPALITLNLAGGAGLSANWKPFDQNLQPLPSYSKMGWGNNSTHTTEFANKAPFFTGSPLITALKTAVPDTMALLNTHFIGVAVRSQDDTNSNRFDITGLAKTAGLSGSLLANLGTMNTPTGNNTQPAYTPPPAPLIVSRYEDLSGALGVSGSLTKIAQRAPALFNTIQKLNALQAPKYAVLNYGAPLEQLMVCRSQDNTTLVSNSNSTLTDPLSDAQIANVWGLNNNTSTSSRDYVFATLVYNALKGTSGSANLTLGGYDYHDGSRATGDRKDAEAGTIIGRIITSAFRLNKRVFILVISDGSVTSVESEATGSGWTSDGGVRGASYMIAVDPTGGTKAKGFQLGSFSTAQAADDKSIVGASPDRAAAAMYANYLSFAKRMDLFESTLPRIFSVAELDSIRMI